MRWIGLLLWQPLLLLQPLPLQLLPMQASAVAAVVVAEEGGASLVVQAMTLMGSRKLWETMAAEAWLPLQIRCAPGSWTPMHPLELLQLFSRAPTTSKVARIHGFRRSSAQPLSPRQRRRRWGWPVSSNSSTCASEMRNSWK